MNAIRFTLAAAALAASGLASAAGAFEGGQASNGLTFEPAVQGAPRAVAEVRAEGRAALLALNSRSGHQGISETNKTIRAVSSRNRDDVKAEALAAARAPQQVFEGGESTLVRVERLDRVRPTATLAGTVGGVQVN
jgi:hypothetical protein